MKKKNQAASTRTDGSTQTTQERKSKSYSDLRIHEEVVMGVKSRVVDAGGLWKILGILRSRWWCERIRKKEWNKGDRGSGLMYIYIIRSGWRRESEGGRNFECLREEEEEERDGFLVSLSFSEDYT